MAAKPEPILQLHRRKRVTWYREWFGEDYLDLYAHRDEAEARRQATFFKTQIGTVRGTILDLACGTGRHIAEFRELGYHVTGCDLSYVMMRTGVNQHGTMPLVMADMRELPFRGGSFRALVNFFTSFGYFATEEDNRRVVDEMARVLKKGGPFLFDYLNVHREITKLVEREERMMDGQAVQIERWFDPSDRAFNKRITIGGRRFMERVRGYDLDEIAEMFASSGLKIHDVFGDFDGSRYDHSSPRLIVVGTKK
jgi:Methylase involved in ubiquinone/menaquinone biosynthesis